MKTLLEPIIALAAIIGIVVGGISYFAKADDLRYVELRLDQKVVSDSITQMQNRVWMLEDRNDRKPCNEWKSQSEREEYRKLQEELKDQKAKQMELMRKK